MLKKFNSTHNMLQVKNLFIANHIQPNYTTSTIREG